MAIDVVPHSDHAAGKGHMAFPSRRADMHRFASRTLLAIVLSVTLVGIEGQAVVLAEEPTPEWSASMTALASDPVVTTYVAAMTTALTAASEFITPAASHPFSATVSPTDPSPTPSEAASGVALK